MRTIRVTGKGDLTVHPDTTRLTIRIEEVRPSDDWWRDISAPMEVSERSRGSRIEPEDIELSDTVTVIWEIGS